MATWTFAPGEGGLEPWLAQMREGRHAGTYFEAAVIARALAKMPAPLHPELGSCIMCLHGDKIGDRHDQGHEEDCPWLMAVRWQEAVMVSAAAGEASGASAASAR